MNSLLIANDIGQMVGLLTKCVQRYGPENLRATPLVIARTTETAIQCLLEDVSISAGFIDYSIPSQNGPHIIRRWREIEHMQARARSFICLATASDPDTVRLEAMNSGADETICLRYYKVRSPVKNICEVLEKMKKNLLPESAS